MLLYWKRTERGTHKKPQSHIDIMKLYTSIDDNSNFYAIVGILLSRGYNLPDAHKKAQELTK